MATLRQKLTYKELLENPRSVSGAMRKAGYSPKTAIDPKTFTESKGGKELMEKFLPDELLFKKHKELLNKKESRTIFRHDIGAFITEETKQPHSDVKAALDMGYKLKGKYAPQEVDIRELSINIDL